MRRAAFLIAALATTAASPAPSSRIVIASDSTAAIYEPARFPQMGWGMFLSCSLAPGTGVVNLARGGRSTKTFREEGLWASLLAGLRPGDTVLIQFGHNDEDITKPQRHTDAGGDFTDNLRLMVAEVRAKGALPVLVTPVARAEFADGRIKETHGAYAAAIRRVGTETRTPLLDLDVRSMAFLDRLGEGEAAKRYMMTPTPQGTIDTTHLNELGARAAAAIVARELRALRLPVSKRVRPVDPARVRAQGNAACR